MKIDTIGWRAILLTLLLHVGMEAVRAQSGDQILDGIGETSMIARYVFDGDTRDWSRNNLHAKFHGAKAAFVNDDQFGNVLALAGGKSDYLSLPAGALSDLESISISGWVFLTSDKTDQYFFDFGKGPSKRFYAKLLGTTNQEKFQTGITAGEGQEAVATAAAIPGNKWVHLAAVVDLSSKTLTTYVDSKPVAEAKFTVGELTAVFGKDADTQRHLLIGKMLGSNSPTLQGKLHDFRIYRVPLSSKQISGIYYNALNDVHEDAAHMGKVEDDLPTFPLTKAQLYNAYLLSVSNVAVETDLGNLPRLPSYVDGVYKDKVSGPKVRVLWPAPTDNSAVLEAGTYTVTGRVPGTDLRPRAVVTVKGKGSRATPDARLAAFHLDQVVLNTDAHHEDTKFMENRDKFIRTLATTDPNSFLYMFRHTFGQPQPEGAAPLGVWDSQDTKLRGHATGHYLSAIAQAYAGTGYDKALQENFAEKMTYMVNTLYSLAQMSGQALEADGNYNADPTAVPKGAGKMQYDSDLSAEGIRNDYWNWGRGYISAYPPDQFIMLEQGATYGGQKNQVWAPYYTLHKILAGLIDVYEVTGNEKALAVATGMSDWVFARLSKIPTETLIKMWNTYIAGEFGGMNESMARLYAITKEPNYLKTAQLFDNIAMFYGDAAHTHGLAKNVDTFRGLHANQHIPQIVGSIEMYRVSHDPDYYNVADNFWYKAVNDYMYSIGGVAGARNPANAECFIGQPATLYANGFSAGGQNETCATYNMLKLTSSLFQFDQRTELMDYYERGLYNHILASVAEDSPANTYHVPLRPGSIKQFSNPHMTGFTCCNGTAIESSTKLQNSIYFKSKDDRALYVNLYIPSTLEWTERNMRIEQSTSFPKEDHTQLTIQGGGKFDVHVRVPGWATKGFFVTINGEAQKVEATAGSYLKLSRKWKDGDVIELKMPFQFHLEPVMDQQNIASLFYGPILLVAQEPEARKEWRQVTFDAQDIAKSISGDPQRLEFMIDGIVYKPFYETYGRHSVYLDVTLK